MAIFGALSSGRSGLIINGAGLSVIGNNIANVGTIAFKGSRTEFADLISAEAGGQVGKIGLGARIGTVRTLFEQGAIEATGRSLDLAIEGQGFFVLRDGQAQVFTRAGNFQRNADGSITNGIGYVLQGTPVNASGAPVGALQDINVSGITAQANPTAQLTLSGNLDAGATVPAAFDPTSFATAYATSTFPTSVQIFDSLGGTHDATLFFRKTAPNSWQVFMGVDAGDTGGVPGALQIINGGGGTVTFNPDGSVNAVAGLAGAVTFSGAAAQTVQLNLDQFTQVAGPSGLNAVTQDGYGAGGLVSLTVNPTGVLSATFDNGQTRPLYQLGIASFRNNEGLIAAGNQIYRASIDSGPPAIAVAQAQGNGSVLGSALEQSNVQIAQAFIDLISTQRAFQANAKVITASDQLLGDLINIIR